MEAIQKPMVMEIIADLNEMEHSRDYWKSKALQYKVDLMGAQKGIRRLKNKIRLLRIESSAIEMEIKKQLPLLNLQPIPLEVKSE